MTKIRSTAAHVLSTGEATDEEAKSLAAYALGDAAPTRTARSFDELEALYDKVKSMEGQHERANAIKTEMELMS